MVLVAGFAASTQINSLQAEDAAARTEDRDQKTTPTTGDDDSGTPTTADESDGADDPTTTSGSTSTGGEGLDALPGDDWGPAAQAQFLEDCVAEGAMGLGTSLGLTTATPEEICGCIYDEVSASGIDLDEFNEGWIDPTFEDRPVGDPTRQVLTSATTTCAMQVAAG